MRKPAAIVLLAFCFGATLYTNAKADQSSGTWRELGWSAIFAAPAITYSSERTRTWCRAAGFFQDYEEETDAGFGDLANLESVCVRTQWAFSARGESTEAPDTSSRTIALSDGRVAHQVTAEGRAQALSIVALIFSCPGLQGQCRINVLGENRLLLNVTGELHNIRICRESDSKTHAMVVPDQSIEVGCP